MGALIKRLRGIDTTWPQTGYQSKTSNPKWRGKKIYLHSTSCVVNNEAAIYLVVKDYVFAQNDDHLGVFTLSVPELVSMEDGEYEKILYFDRPLEYYGKHAGRIK